MTGIQKQIEPLEAQKAILTKELDELQKPPETTTALPARGDLQFVAAQVCRRSGPACTPQSAH